MRLFVAIELDEAARRAIGIEQRRLQDLLRDARVLRWVRPEHMHLTLVFLGQVNDDRGGSLVEAMRSPIEGEHFRVAFGGLGVFPAEGRPRVLWLGLSRGAREVMTLQRKVVQRMTGLGIALADRTFHPHLTLARWRRPRPADWRRVLAAMGPGEIADLGVEAIALVESRLSSAGPSYQVLCRTRLGGDTTPPLQSES
jgi:2'-5' RNA ligase